MSHASFSKVCKYDVFLSFRGEDTRRTIVSHLYNALEQRGIHTFKDDERLETGKSISSELLKAIEEARFAVVIFSNKYASSRWCLEELAHIIKCKNELEQIVIPVFYDVSPSDVRHQNPPFAKSFSKHEKKYKDDLEKVQRWRDAFAEAGKISGYHLKNFKDEADCIKKLVDDIFPKSLQVISPFPESLVGMKSQVEKVTSLLDMESNDVRSIGIWGMGGIGKTEIARVLYQRYRHRFEAACFLGVGTLYKTNGLTWLVQVVICKLLGENMTLTSEHEGVIILENMLRRKKVLFILDDVNHREQLEFLVGGTEWFGRGSKIILTARDKQLLISHVGDNVYEVQLLTEDEALELFSRHAFREKSPKKDFMELSREVVKYAGGLPLALKVLGSSFYKRDKKQWREIIDRLKRIPHNDILGKLRLSFDGLDKDEKELFLDIAFLDKAGLPTYNFDFYVKLVTKSRGLQLIGIDYLIEKSLLSINIHNRFVMHNMIRDMGANVIREEYANNRIWLPEEVRDLFKGKLGYPSISLLENFEPSQLVVLCLRESCLVELWPISKKLSNLKHLDLSESVGLTKTPNFGDMPNLETLNLWVMLTKLNLSDCGKLKKLPELRLSNLKHLDLSGCGGLTETPNFGDMPNLETLNLWGRLSNLKHLNLSECGGLTETPNFGDMPNLETLMLNGCENLEEKHYVLYCMHSLKRLTIKSTGIREIPSSIGNLSGLTELNLEGCEDLVSLPNNLCNLKNLQCLFLHGCKKLEKLPENIGELQELETLDARETAISQPPPSITKLGKLSNLNILGGLPEDLGSLQSLKSLDVSGSNISCLPKSIKELLGLKTLDVQFCQNLNELPEELPPNLEKLCADYHLALKSIRDLVIKCLKLRFLSISWCGHEKSEYGTVSSEQVNVWKSSQHLIRTCIQCDYHQRDYFLICFPEVRIPELFNYQFINQNVISIDLNPSWYTDKFMGFSICCVPNSKHLAVVATLVCKSDPERKHSLKYRIQNYCSADPVMCFVYIPFETLWHAFDNKEGKNPNDYYLFEVSSDRQEAYWGIRLEYENKDSAVTTEIGCSMVLEQPDPSLNSSSRAYAEHNIATDRGLHLGNENKDVEVDQTAMAVQKEHESQNVELTRVCDSPSRKMGDASRKRKRKRKRNRNKKRKIAGTDETSCSYFTNKHA
ncbi:TMV resistance protein N-like [Lycium ferocissimum]|uniref:TMV resistance protein N-like n=1 Tax=Lycium ferocissimum TaxID=112874 RepID=UPI0028151E1D|nr:TMV resistance protein N-like [Lycium ferocissimum]